MCRLFPGCLTRCAARTTQQSCLIPVPIMFGICVFVDVFFFFFIRVLKAGQNLNS